MIGKAKANPCSPKAQCQTTVIIDGSGFDWCQEWWEVAPKAIYKLATLVPTGGGGALGHSGYGSYDLVNKIKSS